MEKSALIIDNLANTNKLNIDAPENKYQFTTDYKEEQLSFEMISNSAKIVSAEEEKLKDEKKVRQTQINDFVVQFNQLSENYFSSQHNSLNYRNNSIYAQTINQFPISLPHIINQEILTPTFAFQLWPFRMSLNSWPNSQLLNISCINTESEISTVNKQKQGISDINFSE